jgi:hypothetical protein
MILEDETVSIKIPAGVVDGMQLKVSNKRKRCARKQCSWRFNRNY